MIDRRKFLSIGLIGLSSVALSACKMNPLKPSIDKENLWKNPPDSTKDLHGFIDVQGNWIIKPQFDSDSYFSREGVAPVCIRRYVDAQKSNFVYSGIIDTSGAWIKEPELGLQCSEFFYEGLVGVAVRSNLGYASDEDTVGYMDMQGNWIIDPAFSVGEFGYIGRFSQANSFMQEPYAIVPHLIDNRDIENKKYLFGIINKKGEYLLEPKYGNLHGYFRSDLSNIGFAAAKESTEKDALYGFIDGSGSWVIKPAFKRASSFDGRYAWVKDAVSDLEGVIDQNGEWVLSPQYVDLTLIDETYAFAQYSKTDLVGVLNLNSGDWIIEPRWYRAWTGMQGRYIIAKETEDGLVGMYSMQTGETIIEPKYEYISYDEPLIIAQDPETELYGYIDIRGEWVIQPAYRQAFKFHEGLASVSSNT